MEREAVTLKKSRLRDWVDAMRKDYIVSAPVKGKKEYSFEEVDNDTQFTLDYTRTMIPPKKYIHPQKEAMSAYKRNEKEEWELPAIEKKTVVLGAHPCDVRAIQIYDVVFGGDMPDPYYWNRRKNTVIVALGCTTPDENCFCTSWDKEGPTMSKGYDLLMTDIGDKYLIELGSLEGSLLVQYDMFEKATAEDRAKKEASVAEAKSKITKKLENPSELPEFLEKSYDSAKWNEAAAKCLSCGTCTMVCPTCFCYHVEDFNRWNAKEGERVRMWDSCQLIDFSEVAMGENFRKDRGARLKWRVLHKLGYWPQQFGTTGCTGCGRCMSYCIAKINMVDIIASMRGEKVNA